MFGNLSSFGDFPPHYTDEGLPFENRKGTIIGIIVPFLVLAWVSVGLRIYTRVRIVKAPGWDDIVIVIALFAGSASAIGLSLTTNHGMGHSFKEVPDSDREMFFLLFYISNASFSMSNALVKLSLLFQYMRVFEDRMPRLRIVTIGLIIVVSIWGLVFSFIAWFPCFPPYQFYRLGSESHCYGYGSTNPLEVYYVVVASNGTNMALDFIILLLPIPLLFSRETERPTKIGLLVLLCIGILINVIAAWRIVANKATSDRQPDPTRIFPTIILLGETENRLSLILASIPVFWPIVSKTWRNTITVTHEVTIESTLRHAGTGRPGGMRRTDFDYRVERVTTEDEATEAGLRHPGRLCEVDRYVRELVSPFAETQEVESTVSTQHQRHFAEELQGNKLNFVTVPNADQ
ncbi:uncharacterized protein CTRU02_204674 [Colletotrichum truncatum]|uniref:Uncharacterized protein n=1 Tax=Colletotrichum truncatum TaxID=5467 RepID=A0ACC3ZCU1_COLTU|nr:uncharacterized protein CTRU02_02907 [Colletotrichum truncatum]KAF6797865.1 hypothetical protein CTRU02_02907 [Colletotrichum truncatum]